MGLGAIGQKQLHKLRQILFIDYFLKKREGERVPKKEQEKKTQRNKEK